MKPPLEERDAYTVADLTLVDLDEPFASVERLGRLVGGAGLHDRPSSSGFRRESRADEPHTDPAPEEVGIDGEPVDVDRLAVELPRHDSGEAIVDERAEEGLSARAERFDGFGERRNRVGADQLRFDGIRTSLNVENGRGDCRIGDVESIDDDAQSLGR